MELRATELLWKQSPSGVMHEQPLKTPRQLDIVDIA